MGTVREGSQRRGESEMSLEGKCNLGPKKVNYAMGYREHLINPPKGPTRQVLLSLFCK